MSKRGIVTFLSDYGLQDEFVGVCRGVMLMINPSLAIVDVHHQIIAHDIRHGAVVLSQAISFLPEAVHLAVVDPTVGSDRRAVVIETASGHTFVGPDNGLLMPAARICGGAARVFELTDRRFMLTPVSRTFQGRDVFAPAAAHLAGGVDPAELGPPVAPAELVALEIEQAWVHDDHLHAEVLQLDRFGNLQLNIRTQHVGRIGLGVGDKLEVRVEGHRVGVPYCRTFADVDQGEFVFVEDSYHFLSLAVNKGNAAGRLRAGAGSTVIVGPWREDAPRT